MTDTGNAAWHPDPSGRYAQRYYDGTSWTEHVVDASGVQSTDPVEAVPESGGGGEETTATPVEAPPAEAPPGGYGQAGGYRPAGGYAPPGGYGQSGGYQSPGGYDQPGGYEPPTVPPTGPSTYASSGTTAGSGLGVGPGLVLVVVGLVFAVLSLFVLDWFSEAGLELTLSDLRDLFDLAGDEDTGFNALSEAYVNFGWLLGLVGIGLALAATLVRQAQLRLVAIVVVAMAAAWHVGTVVDLGGDDSPNLAIGAYLGAAGYVAAFVGAALGPRRRA